MNSITREIDTFFEEKGIEPYPELKKYFLLRKGDAFEFLNLIKNYPIIILGGDVWGKEGNNFYHTYDNWACSNSQCNIEDSKKIANNFLKKFPWQENDYIRFAYKIVD